MAIPSFIPSVDPSAVPSAIEPTPDHPTTRGARGRRGRPADDWRMDPLTRRTGLQGVARARAALEATAAAARHGAQPDAA